MDLFGSINNILRGLCDLNEMKDKINWKELRKNYFRECTAKTHMTVEHSFAPHDLFEWFKAEIKEHLNSELKVGE